MADDAERAAKAARAKAMLKKRQQAKAAPSLSPSPSPAPRSPEPETQDASVLFGTGPAVDFAASVGTGDVDFGEFGVLKSPGKGGHQQQLRGPTSPPPRGSFQSHHSRTSPQSHNGANADPALEALVSTQQQTISLLVSEKASLSAHLDRLQGLESKSVDDAASLDEERARADGLMRRVRELEEHTREVEDRLEDVQRKERDAHDKAREQDIELELARRNASDLKVHLEGRSRELRELQEQVESDDRVETLERSLQGMQERAEEVAGRLARMQQAHAEVMKERDSAAEALRASTAREEEWRARCVKMQDDVQSLEEDRAALRAAEQAHAALQRQIEERDAALSESRRERDTARRERSTVAAELTTVLQALEVARASAADKERLQSENKGLLEQLEEVRPKVVELSNKAAEDAERIWETESRVRALESELESAREKERLAEEERKVQEMERMEAWDNQEMEMKEVKEAYAKVVEELQRAEKRAAGLVLERDREQRVAQQARIRDEETRLEQEEDVDALKTELDKQRREAEEARAMVNRVQAEVETLQDQLALREDEVTRLRESTDSRPSSPHRGQDLSAEILSAARQQHALDLSAAHSRIRALETEVFDAQARTHAVQKRATSLAEELSRLRPDSRRTSLSLSASAPRPLTPRLAPRPVYDANLSAATRHKRAVSLSMLRARIESERKAKAASPLSRDATVAEEDRATTPVVQSPSPSPSRAHSHKPPQFLDESHVFWCHSCHGDLVVL